MEATGRSPSDARALNETMWQVNLAFWETAGAFLVACECADPDCLQTIEIEPAEYEAACRRPHTFVVARAHADGLGGRVVGGGAGYTVVELPEGAAGEGAAAAGPAEFPARYFRALVAQLLDALPEAGREDALGAAGQRFGRELAGRAQLRAESDLARGLEQVCAAVRALGFHASLREVDGDTAVIATPTCPLRPLVAERLEAVALDRGMWIGLIEKTLRDVSAGELRCETHGCLDRGEPCIVTLQLRERHASAQVS